MMTSKPCFYPVAVALFLTACATVPTGPSVMVLPGSGKTIEQFQVDDILCRQWAAQQTGITPARASAESTVGGAAVGTVLGAATGAAIGAASGGPATGAAVGSGIGLLGGTATGANRGQVSGWQAQQRYDNAYIQCMYAKGNQVPIPRGFQPTQMYAWPPALAPSTSATGNIPLPPVGVPPPPPPESSR